jgi:glycosyltransferase involved in cell wall biosynthesis
MEEWRAGGERPEPGPPWRLLMVARFDPVKNHMFALDVASELVRRGFPFVLEMLGDGPLRPHIEAEIERRSLRDLVFVRGAVDDVASWMRSSHLLLLPSYSEGAPRTLIEAAAMGMPFLVSDRVDVGGLFLDALQAPLDAAAWADRIEATGEYRAATARVDLSIERALEDSLRLYV